MVVVVQMGANQTGTKNTTRRNQVVQQSESESKSCKIQKEWNEVNKKFYVSEL
jgi:hypothetical protein